MLASRSPQRRAILDQLGVEYEVRVPDVEELDSGDPRELVLENALRKARAVPGELVLGVDTAVALGSTVYGKPGGEAEARAFLEALSGATHEVWSGLALVAGSDERTAAGVTRVTFRDLVPADLDWYLATAEWKDRAGAYAIQGRGAALVAGIDGDYSTVVGLPVPELLDMAPELVLSP